MGDVSAMIVPSEPDAVPAARRGTPPYLDQQYLGGWRRGSSARRLEVRDPFTRDVVTSFPMATTGDVDEAYQRAAEAQTTWANTPPSARRSVLAEACGWISAHRAEIRDLITREIGGTRAKANFEIDLAADLVRTAAAMTDAQVGQLLPAPDADHENRVYRDPVGVVGVISPFNVPFFLSLKAAAPALALGNAVVIKPHELAPITGGTLIA